MRSVLAILSALLLTVGGILLAVNHGLPSFTEPSTTSRSFAAPDLSSTATTPPTADQLERGVQIYRTLCIACHLPDGRGVAGLTPPLANADYLLTDRERAIHTVLKGHAGSSVAKDRKYRGVMPGLEHLLSDTQIADVLTYVFNAWGNNGGAFEPAQVSRYRVQWNDQPRVTAVSAFAP